MDAASILITGANGQLGRALQAQYPSAKALDHTQLDIELVSSVGTALGRPWLTFLIDAYARRVLACYVTFDPPSWPKPNTQTMSRKLPATYCQAMSCSMLIYAGIAHVLLVSDRLNSTLQAVEQPVYPVI